MKTKEKLTKEKHQSERFTENAMQRDKGMKNTKDGPDNRGMERRLQPSSTGTYKRRGKREKQKIAISRDNC